eukprot:14371585-Alexandrium_andersonii.AAC.1
MQASKKGPCPAVSWSRTRHRCPACQTMAPAYPPSVALARGRKAGALCPWALQAFGRTRGHHESA